MNFVPHLFLEKTDDLKDYADHVKFSFEGRYELWLFSRSENFNHSKLNWSEN